jgi:CheY-like chemotaxis protein
MPSRPQMPDNGVRRNLEIPAMPSICEALRESIDTQFFETFGRHLATAARSARPTKVTTRPARSSRSTKPTPALRILVMEDDAIIGVLLGEMLEGMGYDVCAIEATEADAVLAAARCRPDLMIVDVQLGEGSGVAAVDAIHRLGAVPHVFVSGDISTIRALRPDSISIQKPYRESELALVIQQALGPHSVS